MTVRSTTKTTAPAAKTAAAPKTAAKTKVAKAVPHDEAGDAPMFDDIMRRYQEAQDAMLSFFKTPSWKRTLVAFVTTILVGVGVGIAADAVLSWLMVGAIAMAAPAFLIVVVWLLGAMLAVWYGGKLAARIGGAVLTGEADERACAAYDAVKAKFAKWNPFGKAEIVRA